MSAVQELLDRARRKGANEQELEEIKHSLSAVGAAIGYVDPEYIAQSMLTVIDAYSYASTEVKRYAEVMQAYLEDHRQGNYTRIK